MNAAREGGLMKVVALAGGVGGAKLAHGLALCLSPEALTVIVNTGDDFEHLGLSISPDLDTVLYTLAGLANANTGWGLAEETWNCLGALERLGGDTWFRLGDGDLATHLERSRRLRAGQSLTEVTQALSQALGVQAQILPMTDDGLRTLQQSSAKVKFPSGETLNMDENSLIILKPEKKREEIDLLAGGVRASKTKVLTSSTIVDPKIEPKSEAPDFRTKLKEDKTTLVEVYEGIVDVTAQGKTVTLTKGFGTAVKFKEAPSLPQALRESRRRAYEARLATLREEFAAEDAEMERAFKEDELLQTRAESDRAAMAQSRKAFGVKNGGAKKRGKDGQS
jgi:hypothetical protein